MLNFEIYAQSLNLGKIKTLSKNEKRRQVTDGEPKSSQVQMKRLFT